MLESNPQQAASEVEEDISVRTGSLFLLEYTALYPDI
jgi:hypothetical protein